MDRVEQFIGYIRGVRNLAERTVKSYHSDLNIFSRFLAENQITEETMNRRYARMYLGWLKRGGHKPSSINRMISCLRGYFEYLIKFGKQPYNPFTGMKGQKTQKLLPDFLFETEIRKLLEFETTDFKSCRDKVIFELLYSTGCRVSELCSINVEHLNKTERSILVKGKGQKQRLVFVGSLAWQAIIDYLPFHSRKRKQAGLDIAGDRQAGTPLLINSRGGRLTQRGVSYLIRQWIIKSGIAKKVSPHTFRHTFATHLLDKGADIRIVQEMLGHASLSTTQIYTHVGMDKLKRAYLLAHPHAERRR